MHCTSTSRKIPVYYPGTSGFFSLSGKEICVANKSMRCSLNSSTCSKTVSPRSQVKHNKYTLEERVKMGRYGTENGLDKVAIYRHFSQLLDGKLR